LSDTNQLTHELRVLRDTIALDWQDVGELALTDDERAMLKLQIRLTVEDLRALATRLEKDVPPSGSDGY
jgi:hypothetical protein